MECAVILMCEYCRTKCRKKNYDQNSDGKITNNP